VHYTTVERGDIKNGFVFTLGRMKSVNPQSHRSRLDRGDSEMKAFAAALTALSLMTASASHLETSNNKEDMRMIAPALDKYKEQTILGDLWERPCLPARDRSLVTLGGLIARNQTIELAFYLNRALDSGVKPAEISEPITHLAFYAGWANAVAAAAVAKDVFAVHKISADQIPEASPKLLALNEAAEADRAKRVEEQFGAAFPGIVQYTTDVLLRDLWLRPGLAPRDRSLVTISALIATTQSVQLTAHLNIGMNNGLTPTEISEAITHLAFYVGWPNAFSALPVAKDVFEKRAH
jgi:4-carboxymuconolactone decarboxylase